MFVTYFPDQNASSVSEGLYVYTHTHTHTLANFLPNVKISI
jgi:hypothetical protein